MPWLRCQQSAAIRGVEVPVDASWWGVYGSHLAQTSLEGDSFAWTSPQNRTHYSFLLWRVWGWVGSQDLLQHRFL